MNDLNEYEIFIQIVEKNSISGAAEALETSKGSVSKALSKLENRLKTPLFIRTTRSMTLTERGEHFYEKAREIIRLTHELENDIQEKESAVEGLIRLTMPPGMFGERVLFPSLLSFMKQYPKIELDICLEVKWVDLHGGDFDLALRTGVLPDSSLIAKKLLSIGYQLLASPEYLKKYGTPKTPNDLKKHRILKVNKGRSWRFHKNGKTSTMNLPGIFHANSGYILLKSAAAGMGIARIANAHHHSHEFEDQLVPVLKEWEEPSSTLWVVYNRRDLMPKRMQLLIEHLVKEIPKTTS